MTKQEIQALRQVRAWIDALELHGQCYQDDRYFDAGLQLWAVFAGVAKIHGLTPQQVREIAEDAN